MLCWGDAGGALPVVACCVPCFASVFCYCRCAFSVVATLCYAAENLWLIFCPDASRALCPVLHCTTAQLDVRNHTLTYNTHRQGTLHAPCIKQTAECCRALLLSWDQCPSLWKVKKSSRMDANRPKRSRACMCSVHTKHAFWWCN